MTKPLNLASQLKHLGTETAFAVSAAAAKWADQGHKVYPFHLGDINLPTPPNIIEACHRAIAEGATGYCPGAGVPELRALIGADVGGKRGIHYTAEQVSVQPGGKPVIGKFLQAVMNPGDEVLYPNPGYPIYESQIEYQGGVAVPYGYLETDSGFELDLETLRASITPRTRVLIFNNYQNPNGAESSREEMEALAELAQVHNLWVLSDEAYFEIQYSGNPRSIASLPGMQQRTVILYTCSKRFAMTGWRLGAAIGPTAVIEVFNKLNTNAESCTTHFIQRAGIEAIGGGDSGPDAILTILKARRDACVEGLNAIEGIDIKAPNSTFYLFPNVSAVMSRLGIHNVNALMDKALKEADVSFCTRLHFGRPLAQESGHYIRFAYSGIDIEDIRTGMARLKSCFES